MLQHITTQLIQKQETILLLEDSAKANEHPHHGQRNHLRELTGREHALQIQGEQENKMLQDIAQQLCHKEKPILLLEDSTKANAHTYQGQNNHLRERQSENMRFKSREHRKMKCCSISPHSAVRNKTRFWCLKAAPRQTNTNITVDTTFFVI